MAAEGTVTIPLQSPGHAATLRGKFYAYFKSLRKAAARPDLIAIADSTSLKVVGSSLCAFPSEDSWDNVALREGLGIGKGEPPPLPAAASEPSASPDPSPQEKLRRKLWEIRQRGGK